MAVISITVITFTILSYLSPVAGHMDHIKFITSEREAYATKMASYMNRTVDPCKDFFQYSCGNYHKEHKIKHGEASAVVADVTTDEMYEVLHTILMQPANSSVISVTDKARFFYQSCLRVNIFKYSKSEAFLKLIDSFGGWPAIDSKWSAENFDWLNITIALASYGIDTFISANKQFNVLYIEQDFFGLYGTLNGRPFSRGHYSNKEIIFQILLMYGVSAKASKKIFNDIVNLSKRWLILSLTTSDPIKRKFTINELKKFIPEINWNKYFLGLFGREVPDSMKVIVKNMKYIKHLPKYFETKHTKPIANYMILKLLFGLHVEFRYSRYQRDFCIKKTDELMKDVVAVLYLKSSYHQETIVHEIHNIASYVQSEFKEIIRLSSWLDNMTKKRALLKLTNMKLIIGDDEQTLDLDILENEFRDFQIDGADADFYKSYLELRQLQTRKNCYRFLEDAPRRYEINVNAYYTRKQNKLVIPAGIMRSPYFSLHLPKSYNFGAMGANVIGHELSHGFDANNWYRNEYGKKENWWSTKANDEFQKRSKCFVEQYNSYRIPEMNINVQGDMTLSENIADSGGVRQGYFAYKKWLKDNSDSLDMSKESLTKLNMTNFQLFFLAYAQTYCGQYSRKGYQIFTENVYTLNKFRLIGSISNFEEFGKAFNCKVGTTMSPSKKCILW